MYGRGTGEVNLRVDGTPCKHEYTSTTIGRCLTRYKCTHCSYQFDIDSGD
jgi:transposase-like protein